MIIKQIILNVIAIAFIFMIIGTDWAEASDCEPSLKDYYLCDGGFCKRGNK